MLPVTLVKIMSELQINYLMISLNWVFNFSIAFFSLKFSGSKERQIIALRQPWTQFPCIALCLVLRKVDLSKFAVEKLPIDNFANAKIALPLKNRLLKNALVCKISTCT
jgi:hypothetical protein